MNRLALAFLVAVVTISPAFADPGAATHEPVYEAVAPAIVGLKAESPSRGGRVGTMTWFGTGTIISEDGAILTSTTVVPFDVFPDKCTVIMPGGKHVKADFVAASEKLEVALLRLPKGKYPYVKLGESNKLKLGHVVYSFGNCNSSIEIDDQICVASGEVSGFYKISDVFEGKQWYEFASYKGEVIETTAPLNPGVDGGPLIDARGRLVGIMSLSYDESRFLGVAVPLHVIEEKLAKWLRGDVEKEEPVKPEDDPGVEEGDGDEERGYLGATLEGDAPVIATVAKKSPASKAGLKVGDRIKSVDGKAIKSPKGFEKALKDKKPGDTVKLTIDRDGEEKVIEVKLGHGTM